MSRPENGGGERARTDDLLRARQALSQLSYTPVYLYHLAFYVSGSVNAGHFLVGLDRFELSTSRLSGVRSNQLSYRPVKLNLIILGTLVIRKKQRIGAHEVVGIDLRDACDPKGPKSP